MKIYMTSSIFVLAIFAVVSTNGQGRYQRAPERDYLDFCEHKAVTCRSPLWTMLDLSQTAGQMPELGVICQAAKNAKTCLGLCSSFIMELRGPVRALNGVLDLICDEDNRAEMADFTGARCFTDGSMLRNFERESKRCVKRKLKSKLVFAIYRAQSRGTYNFQSVVCPLVRDAMDCMDEKVEEICDETLVPYVKQVYTIVLRETLPTDMHACLN